MSEATAVIETLMESLRRGTVATQPDLLSRELVVYAADQPVNGREAALLLTATTFDAFGDVALQHEIVSESPGVVVATFEAVGRQTRELFGFSPSGRDAHLKGLAIFRFAGPAICEIRLFAEMAQLFSAAASAAGARSADRPHAEAQTSASSEAATVREVWLAGLGAIATAEEYGSRVLTTLIERGKAWEPVARTSTARAAESVGSAASAATAVVRGLGEKIKWIREPEDTASVPSARRGAERSPTREEFEALKRQVEALVARLAPAESQPSAPAQATQSE